MNCYLMHAEWKGQLKLHQKKIFWCFSITFPTGPCPIFNCKMMQFWGHNFQQYCITIMSHTPTMLLIPSTFPNRLFLSIRRNMLVQKDNTGYIFPSRYQAKIPRKWAKYLHFSIVPGSNSIIIDHFQHRTHPIPLLIDCCVGYPFPTMAPDFKTA